MIAQNYMAEYIAKPDKSHFNPKSSEKIFSKSSDTFKNILNNSIDKNREGSSKVQKNENKNFSTEIQSSITGEKVRTYREISRINSQKVKNIDAEALDVPAEKKDDTEISKLEVKTEVVIDSLANVLGIEAGDLQQLLKTMNIDMKDLADPVKVGQIVDKLSQYLGLDNNQAKVLESTILEINKQADKLLNQDEQTFKLSDKTVRNSDTDQKDWVKLDGLKVEVINISPVKRDLGVIVSQLKMKIDEMAKQLNQSQESLSSEIAEIVSSSFSKLKLRNADLKEIKSSSIESEDELDVNTLEAVDSENNEQYVRKTSNEENITGESAGKEKDKKKEVSLEGDSKSGKDYKTDSKPIASEVDELLQPIESNILNQPVKKESLYEVLKAEKSVQTSSKNEILHQVINKAKVLITGDKSEMIMELKPESLGKLSMKIVTERGIVAAQFLAENQQVKEVLETNMQLLKDSLQKQGLSIQGFSVSVGHEKNREFAREQQNEGKYGFAGTKSNSIGKGSILTVSSDLDTQRLNPYQWSDSSINLTA